MNKMKNIVENTLRKLGLQTRALEYKVMEIWEDVLGDTITKHASVHEMQRGVLFVHVDHPAWIQHLSFAAIDIKKKLNAAVGAKVVKEIRFKAGNRCDKPKKYQDMNNSEQLIVHIPQEENKNIESIVQEIEDPEIRKITASFIKQGKKLNIYKQKRGWKTCPQCGVFIKPTEDKCIHCALQAVQALRSSTRSLLWELPWLPYTEIRDHVQGLDQETYDSVRREMIQQLWEKFRISSKNLKSSKLSKTYIQTYVLLRTRLSPEELTPEIIWQTLGNNMANKLLGGQ